MTTNIQLSFALGTHLDMMVTYEMAARIWETYLDDDVTVNLYVGTTDSLPTNVAGGALPGFSAYQDYSTVYNSLVSDATSSDDFTARDNTLDSNTYHKVRVESDEGESIYEIENTQLKLARANAKSIGMVGGAQTKLDGFILMNDLSAHSTVVWDHDAVDDSVSSSQLDALSVALHEIGHTLGYVSGLDAPGLLIATENFQSAEVEETSSSYYQDLVNNLHHITPLDLFRRSLDTAGTRTTEFTIGNHPYFSINGSTNLGDFSEGLATSLGGDGYQASHWKNSSNPLGIMDPTISTGETMTIEELDLRAFDVIGWDRQNLGYDLASLEQAVQDDLVQQAKGVKTYADLEANPGKWDNLQDDLSWDLAEMIYESQVYESLWGGNGTSWSSISDVYNSLWGGNGTTWQVIPETLTQLMHLVAKFSTFEEGIDSPVLTEEGIFDLTNEARFGPAGEVVTAQLASAVTSDAGFNNLVGFYTVVDEAGGIDTDDDGIADVNPGDDGYTQAALAHAEDPLLTKGQTGSIEFTAGEFVVPFLLANGGDLDEIPAALPEGVQAYFPDLAANTDGAEHFRVSDKTLGIEDLFGGGDQDFNDFVFQLDFA
ncbi:MAG: DUF4114 domain-containing protein [Cyanobacteria bacterium]|jgi:hypothetical protein|nr:DUF4114 domain-containing protein [Cyanobacteria bacterium GSL.Bin1]